MEDDAYAWLMELYIVELFLYSTIALYNLNCVFKSLRGWKILQGHWDQTDGGHFATFAGDVLQKMRSQVGYFRKIGVGYSWDS